MNDTTREQPLAGHSLVSLSHPKQMMAINSASILYTHWVHPKNKDCYRQITQCVSLAKNNHGINIKLCVFGEILSYQNTTVLPSNGYFFCCKHYNFFEHLHATGFCGYGLLCWWSTPLTRRLSLSPSLTTSCSLCSPPASPQRMVCVCLLASACVSTRRTIRDLIVLLFRDFCCWHAELTENGKKKRKG